jgi:hypothetical protein
MSELSNEIGSIELIQESELSFLLRMFLEPQCPCNMRDELVKRIKVVEKNLSTQPYKVTATTGYIQQMPPQLQQAPSTLAAMQKHGMLGYVPPVIAPVETPSVVLSGSELQARENSLEILKKRKQQHLKV